MTRFDELKAAIARAGVRIVGERGTLRLSFGTFPVLELEALDNAQALRLIDSLALFYATDPDVIELAHTVVGPNREPFVVAERVQRWVRSVVPFIPERRERFQNPIFTVHAAGDCDDHAILVGALLGVFGIPVRAEPIYDAQNAIVHVAERVYVGGAWQWAETTIAAEWGENPRDAAIRLGVARPDILG